MHSINIDRSTSLVEVRLTGFLTPKHAAAADVDVRAAIRSLGDKVGQHKTIYDVSQVQIAPSETIEVFQQMFAAPGERASKVAFYTPSPLGRLQLQRIREARDDIGIFADRSAALTWLHS